MKGWAPVYFIVLLLNIAGRILESPMIDYVTKPLLMPILLWIFWQWNKGEWDKAQKWTAAALAFSCIGDIVLMFQASGDLYFAGGLFAFLLAHLFYIYAFLVSNNKRRGALKAQPAFILPFALFQGMFLYLSWPKLAELKIPVLLYTTVISGMTLAAINRMGNVASSSFFTVLFGALLFLISDSLIGMNKFVFPLPMAGALIMLFYGTGQFLIAKGMSDPDNQQQG